ncbi:ChbG/HpnK family deacetylase [Oceanobacillus jeddahense]|uniref:ChbG/HpnK family deacetylase n=1 Tax=Oceanobacillus jeddahense TaxID=1462527 RepID=A0ABY5JVQ8_9BACI|nr:ChbG/HpnK family deacetylase [Oceanobacillus jeddahense]UUI03865.1 ChbG/HpnK family deacetylase [Oceanobacillus jeddahense]
MHKKVLFRADDLGYSEAVNYGIEKSVKDGLISSVGVMVNMPTTLHGVNLLKEESIAFGQHTNICAGKPLADPEKIPSLVQEDGYFKSSKVYRTAEEDFVVFEEALIEIEAQYHKFLELFGKKPDYFEGHAIASNQFFKALAYFADTHELTYSGLPKGISPNDLTSNDSFIMVNDTKVYMMMESMQAGYNPYHTLEKLLDNLHEDGVDMLIFHPGYLDDYILNHSSLLIPRTREVAMLTDHRIRQQLDDKHIDLISYKEL